MAKPVAKSEGELGVVFIVGISGCLAPQVHGFEHKLVFNGEISGQVLHGSGIGTEP